MTPDIFHRVSRIAGIEAALDLLESPNASLDGESPQALLNRGEIAPVIELVKELELSELTRAKWCHTEPTA